MTEGERRIYNWISDRMKDNNYRGAHTLVVHYKREWPICDCCGQSIRVDSDLGYAMFCEASLRWDGREISHNELREILLGIECEAIDCNSSFRRPGEYGLDAFREWGRRELGRNIVLIDLDISVRRYGTRFGLSEDGDLMLIEKKELWR